MRCPNLTKLKFLNRWRNLLISSFLLQSYNVHHPDKHIQLKQTIGSLVTTKRTPFSNQRIPSGQIRFCCLMFCLIKIRRAKVVAQTFAPQILKFHRADTIWLTTISSNQVHWPTWPDEANLLNDNISSGIVVFFWK